MSRKILEQIEIFDETLDLAKAKTAPSSWYTHPEFFSLEQESIFRHHWVYAGYLAQLKEVGDYFTGEFLSQPYIVVCNAPGKISAFYNVCRHHAACVAKGEGKASRFVCPYHGWSYHLTGELKNAPNCEGLQDFSSTDYGLKPIPIEIWQGLIFLHFGQPQSSLVKDWVHLQGELERMQTSQLQFVARRRYQVQCNWKVFVDNYLDGGYHVPLLHRGLSGQLDLATYQNEIFAKYSLQTCRSRENKRSDWRDDFAERLGSEALYAYLYPNLMINRYGPIMDVNWVIPKSVDLTEVVFDYFFLQTTGEEAQSFIEKSLIASDRVQQEDIDICESVQKGLVSDAYHQGRYSPKYEEPMHHFHRLLKLDYQTGFH